MNATISAAPISYVEVAGQDFTAFVAHCPRKIPEPLPLVNGHYLYLYNHLGLRREEKYLTTLEYRYWYQATEANESWVFRYEYLYEPPPGYPYAPCHLHVNARPASYAGPKPFHDLHLPAGNRVTIEALVRHLIAEHGITPISSNWETAVREAEDHFRDIQRKRVRE